MSVVITDIYGNKEKIAEHSKNGSLVVWGQKSTVLKRILACMKIYKVTVTHTVLDQDRIVEVKGKNPQDAHKEALFTEVSEFDKIVEIR